MAKAKKGYCKGVVTCDPSALGLAFTIHIPSLQYNKSLVFNLRERIKDNRKIKKILNPQHYVPLLIDLFEELKTTEPSLYLCDKLIIETQFQENMKMLVMNISTLMLVYYPNIKIEKLSAIKCKRHYSVPFGGGNYDNKIKMFNYVQNNRETLIAGDTLIDHNTADSIIILNTWLSLKNRHFYTFPQEYATEINMDETGQLTFEMKNTWLKCPICKFDTGKIFQIKNGKTPQMNGQTFVKCQNTRCNTNSFFGNFVVSPKSFTGSDGKKIDKAIGSKRLGIWELTDGENKPKDFFEIQERARVNNGYGTIPVQRLGAGNSEDQDSDYDQPLPKRRKLNDDGEDPLQNIVECLARDQTELKQSVFDMERKRKEDFDKLFSAITGSAPSVQVKDDKVPVDEIKSAPVAASKRRAAISKKPTVKETTKRFDVDVDLNSEL
jgi:hypothetical protein